MSNVIVNPRKKFNFRITFINDLGIEPFAAQEVTSADLDLESVEHGVGNTVIKTAGLIKPGTVKIDRIISANTGLNALVFKNWMYEAQNPITQISGDPDFYKRIIKIDEVASFNQGNPIILNSLFYIGCFPIKINGKEYSRVESDNLVESLEFSVDYISDVLP